MHDEKSFSPQQAGFGLLAVIGLLLVVAIIISVAYVIGAKKSPAQQNKLIRPSVEQKAEASQPNVPQETPQDLALRVYGIGPKNSLTQIQKTQIGTTGLALIYGTGLNDASNFTPSEYTALKNSPAASHMPFCIEPIFSSTTATLVTSGNNTATVKVAENIDADQGLPASDPDPIIITITTTLHPLQISNITCPYIPVQIGG
jgi:hypothetical protein